MSRSHNSRYARVPVMKATVLAVGLALTGTAGAMQFEFENGVKGSFDTTISAGVSVRTERQDPSLIGIANGGTSRSVNDDDGDRNYQKNKPFSELLKVTHDLEVKQDTWGLFVRGLYFVDFKSRGNNNLGPIGRDRLGSDAKILDAFVTKSFNPWDKNLRLRAGSQVISWGESLSIPNSINVINAVDLSKARVPGAEIKEALIPTLSAWGSFELSKAASVEAFVLFNHDKTQIDPRGSYFSNNDTISDDSDKIIIGFGRRKDLSNGRLPTNPIPPSTPQVGGPAAALYGPFDPAAPVWLTRDPDRPASDNGQYGVAFRYLANELNNTEFGLYFLKYHSRIPFASAIKGSVTSILTGGPLGVPVGHTGTARYFAEYPEDIRLYGVSFNTAGPLGIALSGEFSYRPNQPLGYNGAEVILASLGGPNLLTGFTQVIGAPAGATPAFFVPNGTVIPGWTRVKMSQFQMSGVKFVANTLGSDQATLIGEVGYTRYSALPTGQKFAGPATNLPSTPLGALASAPFAAYSQQPGGDGFVTENSWGYRLIGRLEYSNLVFGANVTPGIAFSHDVKGVSQTFNEGTKSYSLSSSFNWQKKLTLDLSYTSFFGGRTYGGADATDATGKPLSGSVNFGGQPNTYASSANPLKDRDFYSVVVSYSF